MGKGHTAININIKEHLYTITGSPETKQWSFYTYNLSNFVITSFLINSYSYA